MLLHFKQCKIPRGGVSLSLSLALSLSLSLSFCSFCMLHPGVSLSLAVHPRNLRLYLAGLCLSCRNLAPLRLCQESVTLFRGGYLHANNTSPNRVYFCFADDHHPDGLFYHAKKNRNQRVQ